MPVTIDNWCVKRFLFLLACLLLPPVANASASGTANEPLCDDESTTRTSEYMMYLGCYNRTCFQNVTRSTVIDIDDCVSGCRNDSYQSAALSHGDTCYCGRFTCNRNDTECDSKCGVLCIGEQTSKGLKTCGGIGFIQVYMHVVPFKEIPGRGPYHLAIYLPVLGTLFIIVLGAITVFILSCLEVRPPSTAVPRSLNRSDAAVHQYSTYIISDSRGANDFQEMNVQSIAQHGYQYVGYQTEAEAHRGPVAGTSDHGACGDRKAGRVKHATNFDTFKGIQDEYSDTEKGQCSHEYAYPSNPIYESYTCRRSEVEGRRAQVDDDGYYVMESLK